MNTISSNFSFFAFVLFLAFGLSACTDSPKEVVTIIEEICEDEEKLKNIKAFFDPFSETVYVVPEFREQAQEALGLYPTSNPELFEYQAFNIAGDVRVTGVFVQERPLEELQLMKESVENELLRIADEFDGADQELLASSTTFRNYDCEMVDVARTTRCHAFPGYSSNSEHPARWLCRPQSGSTCTEWVGVIGFSYRYNNSTNCTGARTTTNLRGATCR